MEGDPPVQGRFGRIYTSLALLTTVLGAALVYGWLLEVPLIVQLQPSWVPTQFGTALGLLILGVALLAAGTRWRWLAVLCGAAVAAVGLTGLLEEAQLARVGLERLLPAVSGPEGNPLPGRPPPNTSLAFLLAGSASCLLGFSPRRWRSAAVGLLGTAAGVTGAVALLGYVTDISQAYSWARPVPMAASVALALVLAGAATVRAAVCLGRFTAAQRPLFWPPWATALGVLLAALFLAVAVHNREQAQVRQLVQTEARNLRSEITAVFSSHFEAMQRMARRIELGLEPLSRTWRGDAREYTKDGPYGAIEWVTPDYQLLGSVPPPNRRAAPAADLRGDPARVQAMRDARASGEPARTRVLRLSTGTMGFYLYLPVQRNGELMGFLGSSFELREALAHKFAQELMRGYAARIAGPPGPFYNSAPRMDPPPGYTASVGIPELGWQLTLWPRPDLLRSMNSPLPETVLGLGAVVALLLGLSLRARQLLVQSSTQIRQLNEDLEVRVQRRTQALSREISKRKRIAEEMAHMAKHDRLTGLPNRALLNEHLDHALAQAHRQGHVLAVMFLDLDNFKDINDSFGHHVGDELLRQFADRMRQALREADILARQGGDEFIILADLLDHPDDAVDVALKILRALAPPFQLDERELRVTTSIGIATYPDCGESCEALVKNADAAMYQAKAAGRNTYALYSALLEARTLARLELKKALYDALDRNELRVYYQPRVRLADGLMIGAEALLRWERPGHGLVTPDLFIAVAEESDLIAAIGTRVLDSVAQDLMRWQREGLELPLVAINASVRQFKEDRLLREFADVLQRHPQLAGHLELELTERVFIENSGAHQRLLRELSALGVHISIDDFGTGCSSFSYFRHFPIDAIKIDRSFIHNVTTDSNDAKITETVVDLARNFQIGVVAEGVETEAQREFLCRAECDEAQGWLFGRALPPEEFIARWRERAA